MRRLLTCAAIAVAMTPQIAHAQSAGADFDRRLDLRVREDAAPLREPAFETAAVGADKAWTFAAGLDAIVTSNAAGAPENEFGAAIASPSLSLSYAHPALLAGWALSASAGASTDRYSRFGDDFDESAASAGVGARRAFGAAFVDLSVLATGRFDEDFSDRTQSLQDYALEIGRTLSPHWNASVRTTYRASDAASARRSAVRVAFARGFDARPLGATWSIEQRVQFAAYRAGASDGREDIFARTQLTGAWELAPGFSAAFAARYAHTFSNVDAVESDVFEIAPSVGYGVKF